jgi:hypothetical protein
MPELGKGKERERVERRWGVAQKLKKPDPSFELNLKLRTRVQNSDQAIHAKVHTFLAIFIYLFLLFTKNNLSCPWLSI